MKASFNETKRAERNNGTDGTRRSGARPPLHKTIDREQLLAQLHWRYSTKQFDPRRKISSKDWNALEEALVLTPSSYGYSHGNFWL